VIGSRRCIGQAIGIHEVDATDLRDYLKLLLGKSRNLSRTNDDVDFVLNDNRIHKTVQSLAVDVPKQEPCHAILVRGLDNRMVHFLPQQHMITSCPVEVNPLGLSYRQRPFFTERALQRRSTMKESLVVLVALLISLGCDRVNQKSNDNRKEPAAAQLEAAKF
jgi:hypothetical protein